MAEIPLLYPNHVDQPLRFLVDEASRSLARDDTSQTKGFGDSSQASSPILEETLPGSASASELYLNGKSFLLTTSAKMENPDVLCVALSTTTTARGGADLTSPVLLELDCSQLDLRPLVSVQAFSQESTWIKLVLVDCQGTFVSIPLTEQLVPLSDQPSTVQILKITDYIENLAILQEVSGSELQSTMVAFTSSSKVIVALSPIILTVDLARATSYIWSETQCLEDMRASSFGGILNNMSDLLLGRLDSGVMDMSPTAALCLTSSSNPLFDATFCITLHSDASVRKWRVEMETSPLPIDVTPLNASGLPLPSRWSDRRNAVSLCARTYDQTYAVCVHIKTQGVFNDNPEPDSELDTMAPRTDCHLWVLHGNSRETEGSQGTSMSLNAPENAVGLVAMAFSPTASRCTLSVLFEAVDIEHDRSATIHLIYPPSIMSIVSAEPAIVGHGSLDVVASRERSRIRSLMMGPTLLKNMEDSSLEEILHELDSTYLKYMFRPMFPRGTGTVLPPSSLCIRLALAKLVHNSAKKNYAGMSIELETIRTLYEWKHRDDRKLAIAMTPTRKKLRAPDTPRVPENENTSEPASPFAIYDTFIQDEEDNGDDIDGDINMDDVTKLWEKDEHERANAVEAHERRWRRLLLQVWEEEQVFRLPLLVVWLKNQPVQIMIRAGVTTVMSDRPPDHEEMSKGPWSTVFDGISLRILSRIENDGEKCARLCAVEQQLTAMVASAQLACEPMDTALIHELSALARWAWSGGEEDNGISDDEHDHLEDTVGGLSPSQLVHWIQATPKNSSGRLPGLEIIESDEGLSSSDNTKWGNQQVASYQLRHSACALATRCIDSVRRLQLARCLLLLDLVEGSHARDAALRAYLHAITTLWTSCQRVPMPLAAFQSKKTTTSETTSPRHSSPPNKRLSFGDDATSVLSPLVSSLTTSIDALIIESSQTLNQASSLPVSPVGVPICLTRAYFRQAFSSRGDIPVGKPFLLPELGALPRPKDTSVATDHPRLALRLLAPYVACSLPEDSVDVLLARKESLAECLLIESHSPTLSRKNMTKMRQIACELLVPKGPNNNDEAVQHTMISTAIRALESMAANSNAKDVRVEVLNNTLQALVPTGTSIEIRRLCEMKTVIRLLGPLTVGPAMDMDNITRASISRLAEALLHLSRVMHRLSILERHVNVRGHDEDGETPDVLLDFISGAIAEMSKNFTDEVCRTMPEYEKLWSRLFDHAILTGQWRTAYSACVRNPASRLRLDNFRRMVRSMVDQGALNDLLWLCTELGIRVSEVSSLSVQEASETVDLYEIASEILVDAVPSDPYSVRATSLEPTGLSDYQGALYALHASQKHWRRAAQSMDFRFLTAQKALQSSSRRYALNPQSVELRDGLIIEDLVLASVGSMNAIELTRETAHKFLISGEFGPYNKIAVEEIEDDSFDSSRPGRNKRSMTPSTDTTSNETRKEVHRLSKFMTVVELEARAIRSIALRSLYFDRASTPSVAKAAFLRDIDEAALDIDALFQSGYYQEGLLLVKSWANSWKGGTSNCRPDGVDLFYDYLCQLVGTHLVPMLCRNAVRGQRPSVNQVYVTLCNQSSPEEHSPYVVSNRASAISRIDNSVVENAVMVLVQKLVSTYSSAESPLALDAATSFLESDIATIPTWLERILLGVHAESRNGLFAPRRNVDSNKYLGDPSALLSLYIERGMLTEACRTVSLVLSAANGKGKSSRDNPASRLPEKGDVDFVPYESIDLLWNLIDIVLSKQTLNTAEVEDLKDARSRLEQSVERHYALMQISEMGMRSARALR